MSPEQARGEPVDGRSDLYSLGTVLYEMLVGHPPYQASDPFTVALMHVTQPVPELPAEHAWLQPLVTGLMAKQPAERYNTGASFVDALHKLAASAPESVNLHQSSARKGGGGNRISGSSATQQRTRVNLSQAAEGKPAWMWPAIGGGAVVLVLAGWLMFRTPAAVPATDPNAGNPDVPQTVTDPNAGTATTTTGTPLSTTFGSENAGDPLPAVSAQDIEDLLTRADAYLAEGTSPDNAGSHLLFPDDDSALGLYRQVLASDPSNQRAKAGIESLTAYYRRMSYKLCAAEQWGACANIARRALDDIDQADAFLIKIRAAAETGMQGERPNLPPPPQ
jgi:hypothetical protein